MQLLLTTLANAIIGFIVGAGMRSIGISSADVLYGLD